MNHSEDEALRRLFADFRPEEKATGEFMRKLDCRLDGVEMLKQRYAMEQRRHKRSVIVSGICGVATGLLLSVTFPSLSNLILSVLNALKYSGEYPLSDIAAWVLIAAAAVGAAGMGYTLSERRAKA